VKTAKMHCFLIQNIPEVKACLNI